MPNLINYQAATQNTFNPYSNQYGVNMPSGLSAMAGLANMVPVIGPVLGAGMNFLAQHLQNKKQEQFYEEYMSPQARMAQMKAAGINPNAAAQGISGASAPQMNAASPTSAFTGIGEQLGNSVNTALSAGVLRSEANKNNAEAELTKSLDVKQGMENERFKEMQSLVIDKMKQDNRISTSTANMLEQDEFYHGAEAAEHFKQTLLATDQMAQQLKNMEQEFLNKCAEYQLTMVTIGKTQAEISEVWSRVGLNHAQIEKIGHEIENIDANTALTYENINGKQIENEILGLKRDYEKYTMDVLNETGFDMKSSTNQNYLRLTALGKTEEAEQLMNNVYDYSKGQYGAKSDQTRRWISTATGALATVAGAVMLFVPGLQGAGVVTAGYGINKLSNSNAKQSHYNPVDYNDYSHIGD